jgi:conjugative relaxase-like TrwC/TraI family protein
MASGQEAYYTSLAAEEYYIGGGEPPGRWVGQGSAVLNLNRKVEHESFANLFAGYSADGSVAMVQNAGFLPGVRQRKSGWDMTFSAPKSLSTLWSQAPLEARQKIQAAQQIAVEKALRCLEENYAWTRRGKNGLHHERCKLLMATFEHSTSRAGDPQLHTHGLILNTGLREDGTAGSLMSHKFFNSKVKRYLDAIYVAELSYQIGRRLGVDVEQTPHGFEISGVSKNLCEAFSTRRKEILAKLEAEGLGGGKAAAVATLDSRVVKEAISRNKLFEEWNIIGRAHGFSTVQVEHLLDSGSMGCATKADLHKSFSAAAEQCCEQEAYFTREEYLTVALMGTIGSGWSTADLIDQAEEYLKGEQMVRLGKWEGHERFTTPLMIEIEERLFNHVEDMAEEGGITVASERVEKALSDTQRELQNQHGSEARLFAEQERAVQHMTRGSGQIRLVTGYAGTGKSTMLSAVRCAYELEGVEVIGAALANKAKNALFESSGIKSHSIAQLLVDIDRSQEAFDPVKAKESYELWRASKSDRARPKWNDVIESRMREKHYQHRCSNPLHARSVLVVDEAGMVGTKQMERLITEARRAGAQVLLTGDGQQLQPIGAGGPIHAIQKMVPAVELTENIRQKTAWGKRVVSDLRQGLAFDALIEFAEQGRLTVEASLIEAREAMLDQWQKTGVQDPEYHVMIANRNADVSLLNRRAQAMRLQADKLGDKNITTLHDVIHEKDRVVFTDNKKTLGICNSEAGTLETIDGSRIRIRLDSGKQLAFSLQDFDAIRLGYAFTTHRLQGSTVRDAFVLVGGGMQDLHASYVQASRAEVSTHLFTDTVEGGEDLETIARKMKRERQKDTVHELMARSAGRCNALQPDLTL